MKPTYAVIPDQQDTGRYVVTFQKDARREGIALLRERAGLKTLARTSDYPDADSTPQLSEESGIVFDELEVCVLKCEKTVADELSTLAPRSAILAVEPEHRMFVMQDSTPHPDRLKAAEDESDSATLSGDADAPSTFLDSGNASWGIQATRVTETRYTGRGIRCAVLDTGIDQRHPHAQKADITEVRSFLNEAVMDRNGHGTHCAGTLFGPRDPASVATYGVSPAVSLFVGKVVNNEGRGTDQSVLAGLDWALRNRCHVASLSLGANGMAPSVAFEQVGQRALSAGMLVVAAAGNNSDRAQGNFGFVTRPANNHAIMAVGAVDRRLQVAAFSARSSKVTGGEVDLVGPGVEVFSAWPLPTKYRAITGTSMAAPFVAGIAALYAEATGSRGRELWKLLIENARSLPITVVDVGAGMVQAPTNR